ncbi:MAG: fructose-bisphosphate aldolase [Actinomycetota bacterium]|nr:fructose-bisphosphate aldolase [Actinomycetota bacterium]
MALTQRTATALLTTGKGIFVADEYVGAMLEREASGTPGKTLAGYVDLVLATPGVENWLSGVLMTADTFAQAGREAAARQQAVQIGVRMDVELTRGDAGDDSDQARSQLADHAAAGATFVEWRANLDPADVERGSSHVDAMALARGAALSQSEEILPLLTIAMPDLSSHSAAVTQAVTGNALNALFAELTRLAVDTSRVLLRINMIMAGDSHSVTTAPADVARATLTVITASVPNDVPGVVFLSGGQPLDRAYANLSAISSLAREQGHPWRFTFAFARSLVEGSVHSWCNGADEAQLQHELIESWRAASQRPSSSVSAFRA